MMGDAERKGDETTPSPDIDQGPVNLVKDCSRNTSEKPVDDLSQTQPTSATGERNPAGELPSQEPIPRTSSEKMLPLRRKKKMSSEKDQGRDVPCKKRRRLSSPRQERNTSSGGGEKPLEGKMSALARILKSVAPYRKGVASDSSAKSSGLKESNKPICSKCNLPIKNSLKNHQCFSHICTICPDNVIFKNEFLLEQHMKRQHQQSSTKSSEKVAAPTTKLACPSCSHPLNNEDFKRVKSSSYYGKHKCSRCAFIISYKFANGQFKLCVRAKRTTKKQMSCQKSAGEKEAISSCIKRKQKKTIKHVTFSSPVVDGALEIQQGQNSQVRKGKKKQNQTSKRSRQPTAKAVVNHQNTAVPSSIFKSAISNKSNLNKVIGELDYKKRIRCWCRKCGYGCISPHTLKLHTEESCKKNLKLLTSCSVVLRHQTHSGWPEPLNIKREVVDEEEAEETAPATTSTTTNNNKAASRLPFSCPKCEETFNGFGCFQFHIERKHPNLSDSVSLLSSAAAYFSVPVSNSSSPRIPLVTAVSDAVTVPSSDFSSAHSAEIPSTSTSDASSTLSFSDQTTQTASDNDNKALIVPYRNVDSPDEKKCLLQLPESTFAPQVSPDLKCPTCVHDIKNCPYCCSPNFCDIPENFEPKCPEGPNCRICSLSTTDPLLAASLLETYCDHTHRHAYYCPFNFHTLAIFTAFLATVKERGFTLRIDQSLNGFCIFKDSTPAAVTEAAVNEEEDPSGGEKDSRTDNFDLNCPADSSLPIITNVQSCYEEESPEEVEVKPEPVPFEFHGFKIEKSSRDVHYICSKCFRTIPDDKDFPDHYAREHQNITVINWSIIKLQGSDARTKRT